MLFSSSEGWTHVQEEVYKKKESKMNAKIEEILAENNKLKIEIEQLNVKSAESQEIVPKNISDYFNYNENKTLMIFVSCK